jgi:mannose-6-phosphate isomerase-like protein (cupin superfamily)
LSDTTLHSGESSDQTIHRVLSGYDLGTKLRALRLRRKIGLVDLGKHTGLSASMLSQLENGRLTPTLPTLARIAMVFDVGLDHFFGARRGQRTFAMVRAAERIRFPDRAGSPNPAYFFECLAFAAQGKGLQAYLAEFPHRKAADSEEHVHEGAEFFFVVEGSVGITFEGEEHVLGQGDSVYFDAGGPHSYRGIGRSPSRALVVTTPPRL